MAEETAAAAADEVNSRGELRVELDANYGLRPDHAAILAIEEKLGSLRSLYVAAQSMDLKLTEAAIAVTELMRGYGRAHPDDEMVETYRSAKPGRISELILEAGIPKVCLRLAIIFGGALTGGYTASGEAKAPTMMAGTPVGE